MAIVNRGVGIRRRTVRNGESKALYIPTF